MVAMKLLLLCATALIAICLAEEHATKCPLTVEEYEQIFECIREVKPDCDMEKLKEEGYLSTEEKRLFHVCAGKKFGYLGPNGELNEQAILEQVGSAAWDDAVKEKYRKLVNECLAGRDPATEAFAILECIEEKHDEICD